MNFLRTGGLARTSEPPAALGVRTSYFREEYAYGRDEHIAGIAPFLFHEPFVEAARAIHGRSVIEPAIAYANLMVPGQELAVHTDVPEFRGANRKVVPQWLLVVMQHSRLFDEYRMPIATAVAWFHDCDGGELAYWPDGALGPAHRHRVTYNTALVLDTDTVFHGVDRIADVAADDLPRLRSGTTLDADDGRWVLRGPDGERGRPLPLGGVALLDLVEGVLLPRRARTRHVARPSRRSHARHDPRPSRRRPPRAWTCRRRRRGDRALGELLIDEYVVFPVSTTSPASSTG